MAVSTVKQKNPPPKYILLLPRGTVLSVCLSHNTRNATQGPARPGQDVPKSGVECISRRITCRRPPSRPAQTPTTTGRRHCWLEHSSNQPLLLLLML